jgi:TetR/AcrR family fatty acid metabolism transcriptional regulator
MNQRNEKLKRIIEAGEALFVEKGFHRATVREIAKLAGVGVGTIYEYYPDKEALLLAIPDYEAKELLEGIREHLQGIQGAFNKLRKFTWFTLHYYEANPSFVLFIYLIMKPHRGWTNSPGYQMVREYSNVFTEILKEGQAEEVIRTDVDLRLMRIVYLGSLERLAISWLLRKKPVSLTGSADALVSLIVSAVGNPKKMSLPIECPLAREQRIDGAAEHVVKNSAYSVVGEFQG